MKLIIGLGNPGKEYQLTRHNIGFLCVSTIVERLGGTFKLDRALKSELAKVKIDIHDVLFLRPQTYMNLSGEAVRAVMNYYKIALEDILVIYDDMALPLGAVRIRETGSAGGHNGIKSIIQHCSSEHWKRIRIGISGHGNIDAKDYVLGKFSKTELVEYESIFDHILKAVEEFVLGETFVNIMTKYNKKI